MVIALEVGLQREKSVLFTRSSSSSSSSVNKVI